MVMRIGLNDVPRRANGSEQKQARDVYKDFDGRHPYPVAKEYNYSIRKKACWAQTWRLKEAGKGTRSGKLVSMSKRG